MSFLQKLVLDKVRGFPTHREAADFFNEPMEEIEGWETGAPIPISAAEKVFDVGSLVLDSKLQEGRRVAILLPWYKSTNPVTAFSVMSLLDRTKMSVMLNFGDAFIAHTRNTLAECFLKSPAEWAVTIDDDMVLPCGKAEWFNSFTRFNLPEKFSGRNAVTRLLSHGKTLVGALYFGRWAHGKPVYAEGMSDKAEEAWARREPQDICKPTKWVGTGCMLIHRSVLLDIEREFPNLARNPQGSKGQWFTSSEHDLREATTEALAILGDAAVSEDVRIRSAQVLIQGAQKRAPSLGVGEDVIFCRRALQAGHQPYVDCGLICGHMGNHIYGP